MNSDLSCRDLKESLVLDKPIGGSSELSEISIQNLWNPTLISSPAWLHSNPEIKRGTFPSHSNSRGLFRRAQIESFFGKYRLNSVLPLVLNINLLTFAHNLWKRRSQLLLFVEFFSFKFEPVEQDCQIR